MVRALEAAAKAGVVPVVAAGNDFNQFEYGSISSPANAPSAITVGATTASDMIADFSSGGPTPVSLLLKPDVSAPGVAITSSLPTGQGGPWGQLGGTSMASPHVAGDCCAAKERHPDWTIAQIKSALVQTATPVLNGSGHEISVLREGGGLIDLPRADNPLIFAAPTSLTFPVNGGAKSVAVTDAGGGAGVPGPLQRSSRRTRKESRSGSRRPSRSLAISRSRRRCPTAPSGDITGFVVLTHGSDSRRIPFLGRGRPSAASPPSRRRARGAPGLPGGKTKGGDHKVKRYRYPTERGR